MHLVPFCIPWGVGGEEEELLAGAVAGVLGLPVTPLVPQQPGHSTRQRWGRLGGVGGGVPSNP